MKKNFLRALSLTFILALTASAASSCANTKTASGATGKVYHIGVLQYAPNPSLDNCYKGFVLGLAENGYSVGKNLVIDFQNAQGDDNNDTMIAQNFVAKQDDLVCGIATPSAMACYVAAEPQKIPVVFSAVTDPVSAKLVKSMDKPGVGATGTSDQLPMDKQLKMIRAFMPTAKKVGVLYNTSEINSVTQIAQLKTAADNNGFQIVAVGIAGSSDIAQAVPTLLSKVDCVTNVNDNTVVDNLPILLANANKANIPVFGSEIEQVKSGCVAAQSIDYVALGKQTGAMAAKILSGTDVSTIPVQLITDCQPVANQSALDALHLSVPDDYKSTIQMVTADTSK